MLKTIKDSPGKLDAGTISDFEKELGNPLPSDYREFLKEYNGGVPNPGCVLVTSYHRDPIIPVQCFLSLIESDEVVGIRFYLKYKNQSIGADWLPIASTPFNELFWIPLAEPKKNAVYFVDRLYSQSERPYFVAKSFEGFLRCFVSCPRED